MQQENITLKQLIIAGYQLAKETAQEVYQEEYPIFAAADIGPILEERDSEEADILQQPPRRDADRYRHWL